MKLLSICIALCVVLCCPTPVFAQDRCGDVLVDGTRSSTRLRENSYYRMYAWSELSRLSFSEANSRRAAGVTIGELVLGANFSEADLERFRTQFRTSAIRDTTEAHTTDLLLLTGDPAILDAWTACMQTRGPSIRFEVPSLTPIEVTMVIEYFTQSPGVNDMQLDEAVRLPPNVHVVGGAHCIAAGAVIRHQDDCRVTLVVRDGMQTFPVSINTNRGGATAILPQRVREDDEWRDFDFSREPNLSFSGARRQMVRSNVVTVPSDLRQAGWEFYPDSARFRVETRWSHRGGRCENVRSRATTTQFSYSYRVNAPERNGPRDAAVTCRARPFIEMRRTVWISSVISESPQE